jgi:hypothetical protein
MWLGPFGQIAKVREMSSTNFVAETTGIKQLAPKLTDSRKHREPRFPTVALLTNKTLRHERRNPVEYVHSFARIADRLSRFAGATACEN